MSIQIRSRLACIASGLMFLTCSPQNKIIAGTSVSNKLTAPKAAVAAKGFYPHLSTVELAPGTDCPAGGLKVESWESPQIESRAFDSKTDKNRKRNLVCSRVAEKLEIQATAIPADGSDTTCRNGGTLHTTFTDRNSNGTFDASDSNKVETKVCHGLKSLVKTTPVALDDTTCPAGGVLIEICTDSDNSDTCTNGTDTDYTGQKICAGKGTGPLVETVGPGTQCRNGGEKITRYSDANGNGILDLGSETTGATVSYACNGLNWISKSTAFSAGTGTTADTTACPMGGFRVEFGYDNVKASDGSFIAGTTGTLDPLEIVSASTGYSCNGNGAPAGPYISQFQNDSEGDQARFYWKVASAETNTDWQSYTPISSTITTNVTYSGKWRRVGDSLEGIVSMVFTGPNTQGVVVFSDTSLLDGLGLTVDTSKLPTAASDPRIIMGTWAGIDSVTSGDFGGHFVRAGSLYWYLSYPTGPTTSIWANTAVNQPFTISVNDGFTARFTVPIVGWSSTAPIVKLAHAQTRAALETWTCQSQDLAPDGVKVVTSYTMCDGTYADSAIPFTNAKTGALGASGKCGVNLGVGGLELVPWKERYFKICAAEAATPANYSLSSVRVAGRVPAGMVMVHQDDWPMAELAKTDVQPFTYAIDKYEGYNVGGTIDNSCVTLPCAANTSQFTVRSEASRAPAATINWFAFKKGCANRSELDFEGSTGHPKHKVHLATDREWFTAAAGTPDVNGTGYCNNSNGFINTGHANTKNCKSRYGAENMLGSLWEWTDSFWDYSVTPRTRTEFFGTGNPLVTALGNDSQGLGYTLPSDGYVAQWDYKNLIPKSTQVAGNSDFGLDYFAVGASQHSLIRGGSFNESNMTGRFTALNFSPTNPSFNIGGRCAIVAP